MNRDTERGGRERVRRDISTQSWSACSSVCVRERRRESRRDAGLAQMKTVPGYVFPWLYLSGVLCAVACCSSECGTLTWIDFEGNILQVIAACPDSKFWDVM